MSEKLKQAVLIILIYFVIDCSAFGKEITISQRSEGWGWGQSSASLDKIASLLTFLAFGVFLTNLLLNALLLLNTLSTVTGTTATATPAPAPTVSRRDRKYFHFGRKRRKRSEIEFQVELQLQPRDVCNIMSVQLIDVIDAFSSLDDHCLQHVLCLTSKRAITTKNGFQYMMPFCSVGLSYFGGRIGIKNSISNNIQAIFHGIQDSNCKILYPNCVQV